MRPLRVLAALLVFAALVGAGCSSDDDPEVKSSGTSTTADRAADTTTTAAPTTTTTEPKKVGESPDSPVPLGQVAHVGGWDVKFIGITRQEKDPVVGTAPPAGMAFVVYEIEGTRTDPEPESIILLTPQLLGPSHVERNAASDPFCYGGKPANEQVHQGGTVRHSGCISVPEGDVGHLVAKVGGFSDEVWFATQ